MDLADASQAVISRLLKFAETPSVLMPFFEALAVPEA